MVSNFPGFVIYRQVLEELPSYSNKGINTLQPVSYCPIYISARTKQPNVCVSGIFLSSNYTVALNNIFILRCMKKLFFKLYMLLHLGCLRWRIPCGIFLNIESQSSPKCTDVARGPTVASQSGFLNMPWSYNRIVNNANSVVICLSLKVSILNVIELTLTYANTEVTNLDYSILIHCSLAFL